jgi:NADH-quinone oxidoreductase subunit E
MITERDKREIGEICCCFPTRRAAALEALQIIQKNHSWVSDENLKAAAGLLGMTPDELDGVASFYSMIFRKPVGRHVILVCDSISCWIRGHEGILDQLVTRLGIRPGETDVDGRFTLLPTSCLGACDHAPAMMVDDDLHGDLTPERIEAILASYP